MPGREEVFKGKVLQRLYPAPPKTETETLSSPRVHAKQTATKTGGAGKPTLPGRKVYTVLPPPEEYRARGERPSLAEDPEPPHCDEKSANEVSEDEVRTGARKRRIRRKKASFHPEDATEARDSTEAESGSKKETKKLSKNRRRKLKKKRHKERLHSLGLLAPAEAVEFTYQHMDGEYVQEESECSEKKAREVLDFFKTTLDLYISDRSSGVKTPHASMPGVEPVLSRLSDRTAPPSELSDLYDLKSLVMCQDVEQLKTAMERFQSSSIMPPEEASAVCELFHYWIAQILPLHKNLDSAQQMASQL
ncbi:glutamate-rich protein 1 [Denticeps clupeoides]|uniref:Glutamate rich 1 n=1 Tax=Denticeps clupeoides TaxID=299321 RepID=A0AAY4ARR9_9TELE|nr:glutamate-rich protein 1 [Denticeps clupeoides]